jgi:ubiquilin
MPYSIHIKQSGAGETFSIEVEDTTTVGEMKSKCCVQRTELEVERLTLVYKGRILKDEQNAGELKLADGQTIHLVNKPA